jgi:hypothetical protein
VISLPSIRRGDDWEYVGTFTVGAGTLIGCTVWMTLKRALSDADPGLLQIRSDGLTPGVTILSSTTLRLALTHTQTATLPARRLYVDIQILTPAGKVITVEELEETVTVKGDVTLSVA